MIVTEERTATRQALVDWRGNRYSVPPELASVKVTVSHRLGANIIDIATHTGAVVARHKVAQPGLGVTIRDTGHVTALEAIAMPQPLPGARTGGRNASRPAPPPSEPPPCSPARHPPPP